MHAIMTLSWIILCAPLLSAVCVGLCGRLLAPRVVHSISIAGMLVAFLLACVLFYDVVFHGLPRVVSVLYTWGVVCHVPFTVSIGIDSLMALMTLTVTFVSLLVHVYSIGYMQGDPGYARFFAYMSLFTFFMLMLVAANNFLVLFFGWEGVGLVSYLLIGFWFRRESAAAGGLKAFIVNRVGDLGFVVGIAALFSVCGTLEYDGVFAQLPQILKATLPVTAHTTWPLITVICLALFVGAMAKSAQLPLHIWLPESMEGPTPISALIHAATMVTAGVYMVARLSFLFEYSQTALSVVLVIGATGALFLGILALVEHDIKRVIAYSTLSQLGYMMAATGASAFVPAIFHLVTHASFKALLFLGAGAVIIVLHHEQDMRRMGGLRQYIPITYVTFLIGTLALSALPPFAGFYSKDAIIDAVRASNIPGATYAYVCVLLGAFVTPLYSFRALYLTFHGKPRFSVSADKPVGIPPMTMMVPLLFLSITSILLGIVLVGPLLHQDTPLLGTSVFVLPAHINWDAIEPYPGVLLQVWDALHHLPFWFSVAGVCVAWLCYVKYPTLPSACVARCGTLYWVLVNKYGFDVFNTWFFVRGTRWLSRVLFEVGDIKLIDGGLVEGAGRLVSHVSAQVRRLQSGYLYHYVFAMILGLFVFLLWIFL